MLVPIINVRMIRVVGNAIPRLQLFILNNTLLEWVLDEMIFSFESLSNDWEKQFRTGECDFVFEENGRVAHGPNHTMVVDYDGMKIYQERIQNGFRLFGLYYLTLWT